MTNKIEPRPEKPAKTKSPSGLAKAGKKTSIELDEDDLKRVSGGLKIDYKE